MSDSPPVPKLFQPYSFGGLALAHRVVLAPLTRCRANKAHVPGDLIVEYYAQRASVPGTLLITEATIIAGKAGGLMRVPGIWNDEQVAGWKHVTDAVHAKGSYITCQLWALGRAAYIEHLQRDDPTFPYVSASDVQLKDRAKAPRPLTVDEIREYVELYATAAANAVLGAGFDAVEVHAANGYLIDQFLQDVTNKRTDEYGGSIENRCRFALDIIDAVARKIGASKIGIRLSPWSRFNEMRMEDPEPTFTYLVSKIKENYPELAYIHVIEPRVEGSADVDPATMTDSNDFIRELWAPRTLISAGGFNRASALEAAEKGDLIAFGRMFISNPDLPLRLRKDLPLTKYDRKTFYTFDSAVGYTDYPFAEPSA